ncbi:unnamed protein product [Caenorhabditis angaria]|uniref:Uncharacterized protein n=1 Tax=Caenorhabditis angaria TaxID=860376 RepID=A0A9P1I0N8_9PELO|nr:unnamed protein product [Caenorhabditis angaria]
MGKANDDQKMIKEFKRKGAIFIPNNVPAEEFYNKCKEKDNVALKDVFFNPKDNEIFSIGTEIDDVQFDVDSSMDSTIASSKLSNKGFSTKTAPKIIAAKTPVQKPKALSKEATIKSKRDKSNNRTKRSVRKSVRKNKESKEQVRGASKEDAKK